MENRFPKYSFAKRLRSMLKVDFRRLGKSRLFYSLLACALLIPIVMTVMLTMMDGSVSVDPQTGAETVIHGPESIWQSIGTLPSGETADPAAPMGGMDVMAMCNINMMFMLVAVFVCLFVSDDSEAAMPRISLRSGRKKGSILFPRPLPALPAVGEC